MTCWRREFSQGELDKNFIPKLAEKRLIWITKDDDARLAHKSDIEKYRVSVVWVRGILRQKGQSDDSKVPVRMKDVHRMLVNRLDDIEEDVVAARGPRYFILYMNFKKFVLEKFTTLKDVTERLQNTKGKFRNVPSSV